MVACMSFSLQVACCSGAGLKRTHAATRVLPILSAVDRFASPSGREQTGSRSPHSAPHPASYPFVAESVWARYVPTRMETIVKVTKWVFNILSVVARQLQHGKHCAVFICTNRLLCAAVHRKAMDEKYHFGCQFTADLIAMNTAGEHSNWSIVHFLLSQA